MKIVIINFREKNTKSFYQTLHFLIGFILLPFGHLKSLAKSSLFDKGPTIRKDPGEWTPVRIWFFNCRSLYFVHHTWKKMKICYSAPNINSIHLLYVPEPMKPKIAAWRSKGVQVVQVQSHDPQPISYILKFMKNKLFSKKDCLYYGHCT